MEKIRIQKYFSDCGVLSRRAAEAEIEAGNVTVNGRPVKLGDKIDPAADVVAWKGQRIGGSNAGRERKYIALYKPRGYVCTMNDENGRRQVTELVSEAGSRVYPVGRLDMASEGLLLLTDDGEFTNLMTHPRNHVPKIYHVRVRGEITEDVLELLSSPLTIDGKKIGLFATIGSIDGAQVAIDNDAEGIGFLKSDFLFAGRASLPSEDEQFMAYRAISKTMGTKVTNICMLDMLPEQECSYFNISKESNPAMGMRGIRLLLENPSVLKKQLRAIYRASAFGKVSICIPMVSSANEVRSFKKTAKEVRDELKREGINYDPSTQIGIIVETPAAAVISDILAEMVDFINIGTNDLTQYTLAVDRNNEDLINFYITAHKAVLRLIKMTIQNAHKAEIPVGICGDLAADKRLTEKFLRYGADSFSIIPSKILEMRSEIRKVDLNEKKSK